MPNVLFPNRPCDGTVGDLTSERAYLEGRVAVRYLELGRGVCTAYRDSFGRFRIRLEGTGVHERPITDDVKPRPAWRVPHDGKGGEPLPPLNYHKAKDSSGIVHYRTDVAPMMRMLLCGLPHDDDTPPELVKNATNVDCMGCITREGLLTWRPRALPIDGTWPEYGGWDGPYP